MDKIISIFRPYLDTIPTVDILSTKMGWVLIEDARYETKATILRTPNDLALVLASIFLDCVEGTHHSRTTARMAREAMDPYLAQLTPEQVKPVDLALDVYARLDDLAP